MAQQIDVLLISTDNVKQYVPGVQTNIDDIELRKCIIRTQEDRVKPLFCQVLDYTNGLALFQNLINYVANNYTPNNPQYDQILQLLTYPVCFHAVYYNAQQLRTIVDNSGVQVKTDSEFTSVPQNETYNFMKQLQGTAEEGFSNVKQYIMENKSSFIINGAQQKKLFIPNTDGGFCFY